MSAKNNTILGLSTYKTCLLTLLSPFTSPILDSRVSSRLPGIEVVCGSLLAGAPYLTSSYLSPPGLSIWREMPWSFPSEDAAVVGLEGACPAAEPDSAFALRDAGEPYTADSGQWVVLPSKDHGILSLVSSSLSLPGELAPDS